MDEPLTTSLLGMDRREIAALVSEAGEPGYRTRQIVDAVYRQRVESLAEISTLPQEFRERLAGSGVSVGAAQIEKKFVSVDGTVRYLIAFSDGQSVETVWMPEGDGGEAGDGSEAGAEAEGSGLGTSGAKARFEDEEPIAALKRCATQKPGRASSGRSTICISSQVGCAVDCQFCLTALLGVKRNLTAGEIVGQVCAVLKDQKVSPPEDRINVVFMGMGRPVARADFDAWLPLWDGYNKFYGRFGPTALPVEVTQMTWTRFFDAYEPVHALVAESEGRLVGLVHYLFHRSTTLIEPNCYLQDLFTDERTRGKGVGRALIEAVYERARAAGAAASIG